METIETVPVGSAAASDLVAACEEAWRSIQQHHLAVPDAVIVLGTGIERGRLVKLGHWWEGRWIADGQIRGEVLLAGEALHLQPSEVFEVLLHEAAHGLNAARGIKDVSRGGRYHNTNFRRTAEELGLVVAMMPPYGWAQTCLGPKALDRYQRDINGLGEAMRLARRLKLGIQIGRKDPGRQNDQDLDTAGTTNEGRSTKGPATCGCGRKLRMAPSVLAQGPVLCGLCGQEFSTQHRVQHWRQPERAASPNTPPIDSPILGPRHTTNSAELRRDVRAPGLVSGDATALRLAGLNHLTDLAATASGVALIAEIGAWRGAHRRGDPRALLVRSENELAAANDAARAMLKLDGHLSGPPTAIAGRDFLIGECVVIGRRDHQLCDVDGVELPPAGVLGTVVDIDPISATIEVDFPIAGRHRLAVASAAAQTLRYGYAERIENTGAPLVDLRTLPLTAPSTATEYSVASELAW